MVDGRDNLIILGIIAIINVIPGDVGADSLPPGSMLKDSLGIPINSLDRTILNGLGMVT